MGFYNSVGHDEAENCTHGATNCLRYLQGRLRADAAVNQAIAAWVQDNGYEFNDVMFCIYHVSPNETQNPVEYVNEVCCAVKKK